MVVSVISIGVGDVNASDTGWEPRAHWLIYTVLIRKNLWKTYLWKVSWDLLDQLMRKCETIHFGHKNLALCQHLVALHRPYTSTPALAERTASHTARRTRSLWFHLDTVFMCVLLLIFFLEWLQMLENRKMLSLGSCLQTSHKATVGKWSGRQDAVESTLDTSPWCT